MYKKLHGKRALDKDFKRLRPKIKDILGEYAETNEFEFVACYFAKMIQGKPLPDDLTNLYHKLGGF
jgi:hypothetical protein